MKTRILIIALLSLLVGLSALAQQSTSTANAPQAAPASQSSQSTDPVLEPLPPPPTNANFWDGDEPNVVNLVAHPFARKAWIKRQLQPLRDRLGELDELTVAHAARIKDVDARTQQGLQLASEKTSMADQHANDAAIKAQTAQMVVTQASTRVSNAEQIVGNLDQYKGGAQTEIRFRPGQSVLSKQAKNALDQMASPLKDQHSYIFEIRGFAAGHGQAAIAASQKMADSVVRYLVESNQIPVYRIFVLGMGDAQVSGDSTPAKHVSGGRVEVSLVRNDLVSSAQR